MNFKGSIIPFQHHKNHKTMILWQKIMNLKEKKDRTWNENNKKQQQNMMMKPILIKTAQNQLFEYILFV